MAMNYKQWEEILSTVNKEGNLSKDNIIEKIREKLSQYSDEYKEREKADFGVNHLYAINDLSNLFWGKKKDECTLLHLTARNNLENVTEALLGVEGIDVNVKNQDDETPLHLAAKNSNEEVVEALLKVEGINVNATDSSQKTPLHVVASGFWSNKTLNILIERGADIKAVDRDGNTPLHLAATQNKWVVEILIINGADPLLKNKDGKTPMDLDKSGYIKQFLEKKAIKNVIIAGCATAALSTAIAVTLFATGTVAVELMSVMIAAAIVTAVALAVGGITYSILKI